MHTCSGVTWTTLQIRETVDQLDDTGGWIDAYQFNE